MSNQSNRLTSYGYTRNVTRNASTTPTSTLQHNRRNVPTSHLLTTFGFIPITISHKEEIGIYFDATCTMEAFIDISELCEMDLNANGT
jgi:hypothetical protein